MKKRTLYEWHSVLNKPLISRLLQLAQYSDILNGAWMDECELKSKTLQESFQKEFCSFSWVPTRINIRYSKLHHWNCSVTSPAVITRPTLSEQSGTDTFLQTQLAFYLFQWRMGPIERQQLRNIFSRSWEHSRNFYEPTLYCGQR